MPTRAERLSQKRNEAEEAPSPKNLLLLRLLSIVFCCCCCSSPPAVLSYCYYISYRLPSRPFFPAHFQSVGLFVTHAALYLLVWTDHGLNQLVLLRPKDFTHIVWKLNFSSPQYSGSSFQTDSHSFRSNCYPLLSVKPDTQGDRGSLAILFFPWLFPIAPGLLW